jgi:hypothetical protein
LSDMVVPGMVKGMMIGKWHAALAHGHEGPFVAGYSGAGDTGKNERAMVLVKAWFRRSRKSHGNQDADLTKQQARSAREEHSFTKCHAAPGLVAAPAPTRAPRTENTPCGKHPAQYIHLAAPEPRQGRRAPPTPCVPFQHGASPLWDDAALACGSLTPEKRAALVVGALAAALRIPATAFSGVKASLSGGIRLVHADGHELGIVRATTSFNGASRYNDIRFLDSEHDADDSADSVLVFARLALVLTVTPNVLPRVQHTMAVVRMFREVPAPAAAVAVYGQNLEFVPMSASDALRAVHMNTVEDTWSLEQDVCVAGRFHPNQHFRSTTLEALERSELRAVQRG